MPLSDSTTIAEIFALASAGALNAASSWAPSQARRSAGSAGGFGSSADAPGRAVKPMSGRGPALPVVAGSVSAAGGGWGLGAGAAAGSGSGDFAAARGPTAATEKPRQSIHRRETGGRNAGRP